MWKITSVRGSRFAAFRAVALVALFSISTLFSMLIGQIPNAIAAEAASTEGTDFWLTFDSNLGAAQDLRIYLASSSNASVSISWPDGSNTSHAVSAGSVETVVADSYADSYVNRVAQGTAANSIHITSDVSIAVYGAHIASSTSDAFVAIPTSSLGTEYMLLSHPATIGSYPGRFSLIATESGTTTISITPSVGLAGGQTAGVSYSVSLQQGQVYTSRSVSTIGADISGTTISADKKLVVTSGVDCVNVLRGACDHIVQYIPPTVSWGKSYILPGSINSAIPDRYRVVASQDGTTVSIDGTVVATLNSGQVHQFDPSGTNAQQTQLLETNKPALVGHFLGGGNYGGQTGDPAFGLLAPTLQFLPSYNFATPASGFAVNTLTVVVATADIPSVSIPGVTLSAFSAVVGTNYSVSRTIISAGNYSISADSGLGVYVAGFNSANSYSYPGGYALVDLIQNPGGVAEVLSAASLANLSTSGGDLGYEFSDSGTSYFLVTDSGDSAPSAAEVKAGVDYSGGTVLDSGSASTTANTEHVFSISGLTEASDYVVYTVTEYGSPPQLSTVSSTSFSTKPGVPSVSSVTAGDGQVSVAISPYSSETNFEYSTDGGSTWTARSSASVSSPWVISGLTNGTAYSMQFRSVYNSQKGGSTSASSVTPRPPAVAAATTSRSSDDDDEVVPVPPTTPTVTTRVTTPLVPVPVPVPVVQSGPVLTGGVVPSPPKAPTLLLGGRPTVISTTVPTTNRLDVTAGRLALGVKVLEDQGTISEAPDGTPEISVRKGASATLSGSGFRPGATVQVFMPLAGDNAKELTRIPVNPDGSFDGSAPFATRPNEAPLPIGKNVLQLVSLDNDGNQVVVEMAVNIAQGAPAPEQNRIEGVIPTMTPGQSIATSGGEPVPVTVTPVSDQKLAVVEGDGWTMAINVASENGGVEPSEGGALLKLVRNDTTVVSGSGFMPGTRADVWLFSDPTLLGTVTIDENGEFNGEFNVDPNMVPVGEHTLQLQGVGEDGYVKAANLGVMVDDPVEAMPTTVETGWGFIWWIVTAVVLLALIIVLLTARRRREQN